jgi:hypothetical protein
MGLVTILSGSHRIVATNFESIMTSRFTSFAVVALASLTSAAFSQTTYRDALIKNVPHVRQRPDFCGEACVEMALRKLGKRGDQNYVFNISGLDPAEGRGCYSADLLRALNRIGFKPGNVFFNIDVAHAEDEIESQWKSLHADLVQGIPSIVCMHYDSSPKTTEHMRLIVGYHANTDEVVYLDPAEPGPAYRQMKRARFLSLWPLKYEEARWLIVRFRMEPADIREPPTVIGITNADYAQHILALKKNCPTGSVCLSSAHSSSSATVRRRMSKRYAKAPSNGPSIT